MNENKTTLTFGPLRKAVFIEKHNRFLCTIEIGGKKERCCIPGTARGTELFVKGAEIRVAKGGEGRKTRWTLILLHNAGVWVCIDANAPTRLLYSLLLRRELKEFNGFNEIKPEPRFEGHRLDFLLRNGNEEAYIEVKSVTLVRNGLARFPGAPTSRGTAHLNLLSQIARKGIRAYIVFIIQRSDANELHPNYNTDEVFSASLLDAISSGVKVLAWKSEVSPAGMRILDSVPVLSKDPHVHINSGAYRIVIKLEKEKVIPTGRFRGTLLERGWYIYTGSGMHNLLRRVSRQLRGGSPHWHIDHLLAMKEARIVDVLLYPSEQKKECELAREVLSFDGARVPLSRFGSTDCRSCPSHLAYFRKLPEVFAGRLPIYRGVLL